MIWAQNGTLGIRDEGLTAFSGFPGAEAGADADTDTLHRCVSGNTGTGVRHTRVFTRAAA